jgi:hypothetical protein
MSDLDAVSLTPRGWTIVAAYRLLERFPELTPRFQELTIALLPLFEKAINNHIHTEKDHEDHQTTGG